MKLLNKHKEIFLAIVPFFALVTLFAFLFFKSNLTFSQKQVIGENIEASQISANYYEYSDDNLKMANESGKTVLFFATNWCSTCTALDNELMNESEKLDNGISILKLDYDSSSELKRRYGVTVQHTLVQIDSSGNEIAKWVGGDINTINQSVK